MERTTVRASDTAALEISRLIRPGGPLLVLGPPGCGKLQFTESALVDHLRTPFRTVQCPELDELGLNRALVEGRPLVFADCERLDARLAGAVRHFLAMTSRSVVLVAASEEKVDKGLLAQVRRTVEVEMDFEWLARTMRG